MFNTLGSLFSFKISPPEQPIKLNSSYKPLSFQDSDHDTLKSIKESGQAFKDNTDKALKESDNRFKLIVDNYNKDLSIHLKSKQ